MGGLNLTTDLELGEKSYRLMLCVLYYCGSGVRQRCDWQLEAEVDTGRPHDRQLVNAGEGEAVEVEDVVAVV